LFLWRIYYIPGGAGYLPSTAGRKFGFAFDQGTVHSWSQTSRDILRDLRNLMNLQNPEGIWDTEFPPWVQEHYVNAKGVNKGVDKCYFNAH